MAADNSNGGAALRGQASSRTRSIAFVGLTIALIAVSAWITVPLGPIPFTLQMFAITFALVVLKPREAMEAIVGYLLLGALGVPVFSGMRGGLGVLMGPTGGFLWGYILGVAAALLLLSVVRGRMDWGGRKASPLPRSVAEKNSASSAAAVLKETGAFVLAGVLFTAISYACGMLQYMAIAQVSAPVAFATCCAPFIVVDLVKIVAAVLVAQRVRAAVAR